MKMIPWRILCTLFSKEFNFKRFMKKARKYDQFESEGFEELVAYCKQNSEKVIPQRFGLKIVVISDSHGDLAFDDSFADFMNGIPKYDFVVILGDIYCYELDKIKKIVPADKIIALRGNHDNFDVYDKYGIQNINGKIFTYKGIRFAGIEGSFKYKKEDFPSYTHYESLLLAFKMHQQADILITHDCAFMESKYDIAHSGLASIIYYIYKNRVQRHIHGHIHKSYKKKYSNGTKVRACIHLATVRRVTYRTCHDGYCL